MTAEARPPGVPSACTRRGTRCRAGGGGQSWLHHAELATAAAGLPADAAEFVAEVKWDGLRACIAVAGGRVRAWSRGGRDITTVYPELGALGAVAGRRGLVLDGEIIALSVRARTSPRCSGGCAPAGPVLRCSPRCRSR